MASFISEPKNRGKGRHNGCRTSAVRTIIGQITTAMLPQTFKPDDIILKCIIYIFKEENLMNTLKRTLALAATIAMAAASLASCGDDQKTGTGNDTKTTTAAKETTTAADDNGEDTTKGEEVVPGQVSADVKTGGDTFTLAAWNHDDVPYLIAQWKNLDYDTIVEQLAEKKVEGVDFIDMNVKGGEAAEKFDQYFNDGTPIDVYFCEADWALKYINDDTKTLALEKLGLTDEDFSSIYDYTDSIGQATEGKNAGKRVGVSWQAAAGGFAYRADLAKEYLGVNSPAEMQDQINDWDKFVEAAKKVSEKTEKGVALADSLGGLWQAFACERSTPWVVNNKVEVDATCEKFANTVKELWDINAVAHNDQWTDEWTAAGVSSQTMGYFVSTWGFGGFFLDAAGGVDGAQYGNWALCQGPTPFYWGGTWIVVNPATDNGEEARDFIKSATCDYESMKEYAVKKPEYVNNSKVMDDLISSNTVFNEKISGNFADNQNYFAELASNAKSIDFKGLITPYDATLKALFADAVRKQYIEGGKSWDETVDAFLDKAVEAAPDLDVD